MGRVEIKKLGSAVLRGKAGQAVNEPEKIRAILNEMAGVMRNNNGVGLAAPQIGFPERIVIMDWGEGLFEMINPEITRASGSRKSREGCLSIPGVEVEIDRAEAVFVKGVDGNFKPVEIELAGLPARIIQHEIDHLNGVLIVDYLSCIRRKIIEKQWKTNSK